MSLEGEERYHQAVGWLALGTYKLFIISDLQQNPLAGELHLYLRPGSASRREATWTWRFLWDPFESLEAFCVSCRSPFFCSF